MFNLIIELYRYRNFIKKIGVNRTKRRFRFGVSSFSTCPLQVYTRLYNYKCTRVFIVKRVYASILLRVYACAHKKTRIYAFKIINENTRLPIAHVMYK